MSFIVATSEYSTVLVRTTGGLTGPAWPRSGRPA
jgi:hypothetical protein